MLPLTVTPSLDASATSASLPSMGVASTVNAEVAGTEEVFSASLKVSVSVNPLAASTAAFVAVSSGGTWSASWLITFWSGKVATSLSNASTSLLAVPVVGLV